MSGSAPQTSDEAIEAGAQAFASASILSGDVYDVAQCILAAAVPLLYQQWETERLGPVHAVIEHARKVSPTARAVVLVTDVEAALGLPSPVGVDRNGRPIGGGR